MKTCGQCKHAVIMPKDLSKRQCWGAPPTILIIPGAPARQGFGPNGEKIMLPPGAPQTQAVRPVALVNANDRQCALFSDFMTHDEREAAEAEGAAEWLKQL